MEKKNYGSIQIEKSLYQNLQIDQQFSLYV